MPVKPFPLLPIFSVASLLVLGILTLLLSWVLGNLLEEELIERDILVMTSTIQGEVAEYLHGRPFKMIHDDPQVLRSLQHLLMVLPGSYGFDVIHPNGLVTWSSFEHRSSRYRTSSAFQLAMEGTPSVQQENVKTQYPEADPRYAFALYVPIFQDKQVIGVIEFHRFNKELQEQVRTLRKDVWGYCLGFGIALFLVLLLIVAPASRILRRQHSDLQQINQALQATQEQLLKQERLAAMGEVSAAVAHGLKNPIAGLRAAMQLLSLPSISSAEHQDIVNSFIRELDHLNARVEHLLDFVRPFAPYSTPLELYDVMVQAERSLEWKLEEAKLQLEIAPNPNLPEISADLSLLEEAVLIVLDNAINASQPGGKITCEAGANQTEQWIRIRDEGEGIAEKHRDHIFDHFYTTRSQGIGLGLPLCKKIMEAHHGRMELETEEHQGTTVYLFLPTSAEARS